MFGKIFFFGLVAMSLVCSTLGGGSSSLTCDYYIKIYLEKEAILKKSLPRIADDGISEVAALDRANPIMWFENFFDLTSPVVDSKLSLMKSELHGFYDLIGSITGLSSEIVENYLLYNADAPYPLSCIKQFANLMEVFQTEKKRLVNDTNKIVNEHPDEA